jgi:hypothetical protein
LAAPSAAQPGAPAPPPIPWKVLRSSDGKTRLDFGAKSVISDPASGKAIVLDHLKKEAVEVPVNKTAPAVPGINLPGLKPPGLPTMPAPPQVQDLGKKMIDGHEAEGKLFTIPPPPVPKLPSGLPKPPGLPGAPAIPGAPKPPAAPQTVEMWTSKQFGLPVMTKVTGSFGQQISKCQCTPAQHPPAAFQIPAGYKFLAKS